MRVYRVKGWDKHFENSETRKLKSLKWVPIPNKQDGSTYRALWNLPKAPEVFAAWILILEVASKCPDRGTLLKDGEPIDAAKLALRTGCPEAVYLHAIPALTAIGWLELTDVSGDGPGILPEPPETSALKGREGKGRELKGKDNNDSCAEPATAPAPAPYAVPELLKGLALYEADRKLCMALPQLLGAWTQGYPGVNLRAEIAKAHAWEVERPTRRKVNRARFLGAWLARVQDSAPSRPTPPALPPPAPGQSGTVAFTVPFGHAPGVTPARLPADWRIPFNAKASHWPDGAHVNGWYGDGTPIPQAKAQEVGKGTP